MPPSLSLETLDETVRAKSASVYAPPEIKEIQIAQSAKAQMQEVCAALGDISPHSAEEVGVIGISWLRAALSEQSIREIREFKSSPAECLLLKGLDFNADIHTPENGFLSENKCVLELDLLQFAMLRLMSIQPFAVPYENDGKIVRNVLPVKEASGTCSSWGSDLEFSWHTDNPNWPFRHNATSVTESIPRFLSFAAVRNNERVSTDIVSVDGFLSNLDGSILDELRRPAFSFNPPMSNEGHLESKTILPVLEDHNGEQLLRFDENAVTATDKASAAALEYLTNHLRQAKGVELVLGAGDFFIFKNERVLHRRRAFRPAPAGRARWLRRVYGC